MKLSYIITTYNRNDLLGNAIRFVVRERCEHSELIVVDDNSHVPAKIPDFAKEAFPNACRLIRNRENLGVIGARNAGLSAARGEYVLFLDDDDESFPNRTRDLLSAIETSGFDFVAARAIAGKGEFEKTVPASSGFLLTPEKILLYPSHIDAIIWRRSMFAGGLDNRVPYLGEHISLIMCLLHGGSAWLSEAVVACFAYIESGLTVQAQEQNALKDHLLAMHGIFLEESETPSLRQLFSRIISMLQAESIRDFDDYLQKLEPVIRRHA